MFSHNTCIGEKLKDLKAQLDKSCPFYGPLKFTLESVQNAKFAVSHTNFKMEQLKFDNGLGDRFNFEQLYG